MWDRRGAAGWRLPLAAFPVPSSLSSLLTEGVGTCPSKAHLAQLEVARGPRSGQRNVGERFFWGEEPFLNKKSRLGWKKACLCAFASSAFLLTLPGRQTQYRPFSSPLAIMWCEEMSSTWVRESEKCGRLGERGEPHILPASSPRKSDMPPTHNAAQRGHWKEGPREEESLQHSEVHDIAKHFLKPTNI